MPDSGFEGLVISNLDHLSNDIRTIKLAQEAMQLDLTSIKLEQVRQKQRQEELAGPLKQWSLEDSVALKRVIDKERSNTVWDSRQEAKSSAREKVFVGWRDRLLLVTAALSVFILIRDELLKVWTSLTH